MDSPSNFGSNSTPLRVEVITFLPTASIKVEAPGFKPLKFTRVLTMKVSVPEVRSKSTS